MQSQVNEVVKSRLTRSESAEYLTGNGYPTSKTTLAKLACIGGGPEYQKFGRRVLYRPESLILWAEGRLSQPLENASQLGGAR